MDGKVKKHNARNWMSESSQKIWKFICDTRKVTIRCALSIDRVIGSHYFDDLTVLGDNHVHLLNIYFVAVCFDWPKNIVFYQDGALQGITEHYKTYLMRNCQIHGVYQEVPWELTSSAAWLYFIWLLSLFFCQRQNFHHSILYFDPADSAGSI